jgi:predicted nucleic acid-binding protein
VVSALEIKASVLYTEDMRDDQLIEGTLRIANPYRTK